MSSGKPSIGNQIMNLLTNQIARFKAKRFIKEIREADLKQI